MNNDSKKVFAYGLQQMINGYNPKLIKLDDIKPDVLEDHLSCYNSQTLSAVSDLFRKKHPERMTSDAWIKRYQMIAVKGTYDEFKTFTGASHYNVNSILASLYFDAIDVLKKKGRIKRNWTELFEEFKDGIERSKYIGQVLIPLVCSRTFKEDPESAKKFMYDVDFKKLKAPVRTAYYKAYIKAGLLDQKIARRIRSDGAEKTSCGAIKAFIENLDLYDNPKSLLTQFVDIKHLEAQYYMARNAPDYMIPFMMGFEYSYAKKTLESRAMNLTKKKEEESSNG